MSRLRKPARGKGARSCGTGGAVGEGQSRKVAVPGAEVEGWAPSAGAKDAHTKVLPLSTF